MNQVQKPIEQIRRSEGTGTKIEVTIDSKLVDALDRWRSMSQGAVSRPEAATFMLNAMLEIFRAPSQK